MMQNAMSLWFAEVTDISQLQSVPLIIASKIRLHQWMCVTQSILWISFQNWRVQGLWWCGDPGLK